MLTYAREFATISFPDMPPPQLANGGLCVLCQQSLDETATTRLVAFDDYIAGRASEESSAATNVLAEHHTRLMAFRVKRRSEVETLLTGYADLSDACKQGAATMATFVGKAGERLEAVKSFLGEDRYDLLEGLDPLPESPAQYVDIEINHLDTEINKLEIVERNEDAIANLQANHDELADQKWLSENIEIIVERRNRLVEHHRLNACRKQCRLTGITRRITKRRREILTPTLRANLGRELKRLRLTHIPMDLTDRGEGAESIVEIVLSAQQRVANKSAILSEGEHRALALACFLAELQEIGSDHGIIVDDPVSSLDHDRMQAVAERLAKESSKGRQVIVFTHNILFHHMLCSEARRSCVGMHCVWMSNAGNDRYGLIDNSKKPHQMKGVCERLNEIQKDFAVLTAGGYDHTNQKFRREIIGLYTYMRETWERIIEEILFNNVVQRFRPEIKTMRLKDAPVDPEADYPAIFEGMTRCSSYSGHDRPLEMQPAFPSVDQICSDIKQLKDFAEKAQNRRKQLRKTSTYEYGVKAVLL